MEDTNNPKVQMWEQEDELLDSRSLSKTLRARCNDFKYVLAMCLRKLGHVKEASETYVATRDFLKYEEKRKVSLTIFGIIMCPFT